jgi:predicted NACHT family NTPase
MLEWQTIIESGVKAIAPKLLESAVKAASAAFASSSPYKILTFDKHFQIAYERCTKVKTIVNGDRPIDLLQHYVNPSFKQRESILDEYEFIDAIWENRRVALIGAAGSGKSMFMRYFWIACSVEPRGKIPIYVELRKFNERTDQDFTSFLLGVVNDTDEAKARPIFKSAMEEGQFIFIFDGFDEIEVNKRHSAEAAILKLGEYKNGVVVSSRPDDIFFSWQSHML